MNAACLQCTAVLRRGRRSVNHPQRHLSRRSHQPRIDGKPEPGVQDSPYRCPPGKTTVSGDEQGIVRQCRADSDQDRVMLGPERLDKRSRPFSGNSGAPPAGSSDGAVQCRRDLQCEPWSLPPNSSHVTCKQCLRGIGKQPGFDPDTATPERFHASAGDPRIRVEQRYDATGDSRFGECIGAGGRLTMVCAGLERYICGCARGHSVNSPERFHFGMRATAGSGPPGGKELAVLDENAANGGIGPGTPQRAPGEVQAARHPAPVCAGRSRGFGQSVSAGGCSCASRVSKSSAFWKFLYTDANRT